MLGSLLSSGSNWLFGNTNRAAEAEGQYGRPAQGQFGVPQGDAMYGQYNQMIDQQRGPGGSAFYGDQRALGQQLALEAQGKGIGQQVVRQQAQQQADQILRQQLAQSASTRPGMGAMAARNAAMNSANAQSAVGGQAAMAGGQMALGAQGQYANFLQGARQQDLDLMGMNDRRQLDLLSQRLQLQQMQQQGNQAYEGNRLARYQSIMGTPTQGEQNLGMVQAAGSMAAMMSDKNLKKGIKSAEKEADALMKALTPSKYAYKDEKWGKGNFLGIMAQDLEKTKLGKSLVINTPEGKAVDTNKSVGTLLAGMSRLNQRLVKLEGK